MLESINTSLKALEKSYMLTFREVSKETIKLNNLLDKLKKIMMQMILISQIFFHIANTVEKLSIKNEYKLNLD